MKIPTTKRMIRRIAASIAIITALEAAQTTLAAARNWTGNGSDTLWRTESNWDAVPTSSDWVQFRQSNPPNKTATLDALYSYDGNMHLGLGSSAASPYVFEASATGNGLTIKDDVWLGYWEDGWLWLKSGVYIFGVTNNKGLHIKIIAACSDGGKEVV